MRLQFFGTKSGSVFLKKIQTRKMRPKEQTREAPVGRSRLKDITRPDRLVTALTRLPIINCDLKWPENKAPTTAGTIKNVKIRKIPAVLMEVTMTRPSVR